MPAKTISDYLKWLPLALVAVASISANAVQAYQVSELKDKVGNIEDVQLQQAVTENNIIHIQSDVESLDDNVKDLDDKMDAQDRKLDLILQQLRRPDHNPGM